MIRTGLTKRGLGLTKAAMRKMFLIGALGANGLLGGCINVAAPDKPIEINLNINVKAEVVYRLDGQAKELIKDNPGIF